MYNIIPLILILACLIAIIVIVARKFSVLANLDVDNIPSEKEGKFKEMIAGNRIKRNIYGKSLKIKNGLSSVFNKFFSWGERYYGRLKEMKNHYDEELKSGEEKQENQVETLMDEVSNLNPKENYEEIENKLIKVIGLDSKNSFAFEKLGDIYFDNKRHKEAKETYEYLLNLLEEGEEDRKAKIYFYLALLNKEEEKYDQVLSNIKEALEISPNNPRYLDIKLETSIILEDKKSAEETLGKLEEVNPENQKIEKFKKQIKELK